MSGSEETVRPGSTTPTATTGEVPSASNKKTATRLELLFCLPFSPYHSPFRQHEPVLQGITGPNIRIVDIMLPNYPNMLKDFINDNFDGVTQLGLEFMLGKSLDDVLTSLQLRLCFKALLPLADQCAFEIKAEYYGVAGLRELYIDGELVTCRRSVTERFRIAAGDTRDGDLQKLNILDCDKVILDGVYHRNSP